MKKRLAVYTLYEKNGVINDYVVYCLNELKKVSHELIVVSNCKIQSVCKDKLSFVDHYFERSDKGFDVGAFADLFTTLFGWKALYMFDELIVMNDSTFGPVYPFSEMFDKMDMDKSLDFWGITERGRSDFDGGSDIYPEHIQLYFYVVRNRMLHSPAFRDYFETITEKVTDFRSAIINYEFYFTDYFAKLGFKWDVYCRDDNYVTDNPKKNLSPYHYYSSELVEKYRCPLIKRKLFTGDFVEREYSDRRDFEETFDYINKHTDYDVGLMWQFVLSNYDMHDIMHSLNLCRVLSSEKNYCKEPEYGVICLSEKSGFEDLISLHTQQCEYTLVIDLETKDSIPHSLRRSLQNNIIMNLADSHSYIKRVTELFDNDIRLGVLIPPADVYGNLFFSANDKWPDAEAAYQYYSDLKLTVPFSNARAPIHKINAFWCRSRLLTEEIILLLKKDKNNLMKLIPLIAQQSGYYTSVIINERYVPVLLKNIYSETESIINAFSRGEAASETFIDVINDEYRKKIKSFCADKSKIFIYGAGKLAQQVVKLTAEFHRVDGIFVSDTTGNTSDVYGITVRSIKEFDGQNHDSGFILAVGRKNNTVVAGTLNRLGINDLLILD